MRSIFALLLFAWITGIGMETISEGQTFNPPPPILKVRLKIEGVRSKSDGRAIHRALMSVPGVKNAEVILPRRWLFFRDYKNVSALVEFVHGTLTSETLIQAVENASQPQGIFKAKFLE